MSVRIDEVTSQVEAVPQATPQQPLAPWEERWRARFWQEQLREDRERTGADGYED